MNVNLYILKDYRKKDDFVVRINKPNSNPISERVKIDAKCVFTKDYEEKCGYGLQKNKAKTNPISNPTTVFLLITKEIATGVWQNISAIRKGFAKICIPVNSNTGFPWKPGHHKIKESGLITCYPGILVT